MVLDDGEVSTGRYNNISEVKALLLETPPDGKDELSNPPYFK